jgi:hypothetical protein
MNDQYDQYDQYKVIGAGLVVLGSIPSAFLIFMNQTGISGDIAARCGDEVKDLVLSVGVVLAIMASAVFVYYFGIAGAGANPIGTGQREKYDALRESLAAHEDAKDSYARRLKAFLAKVDAFFGDTDVTKQRFFLLREQAALWTAPAFDRCLSLALFYPIAAIFVIWAVSGQVGPAEAALSLKSGVPSWFRGFVVAALGFATFANWRIALTTGWKSAGWCSGSFASAYAALFAGASIAAIVATGVGYTAVRFSGGYVVAYAVASAFASAFALAVFPGAGTGTGFIVGIGAVGVAYAAATAVEQLSIAAIKRGWQGRFLALFLAAMVSICLSGAYMLLPLEPLEGWNRYSGPLLLFLGLLTLLNAPFDWASLGLTRALLRFGIEQGGPWPFFYALIDALD